MSEEERNIDHKIKQAFDAEKHVAPDGLWDKISGSMDADLNAVQDAFADSTESAPGFIWGNIENQLIVDKVWTNIDAIQEKRKKRDFIWFNFAAFVGIVALLLGIWSQQANYSHSKQIITADHKQVGPVDTKLNIEKGSATQDSLMQFNPEGIQIYNLEWFPYDYSDYDLFPYYSTYQMPIFVLDEPRIAPEFVDPLPIRPLEEISGTLVQSTLNKQIRSNRKWEVGLTTFAGNGWILDNATRDGFRNQSLIENRFSPAYSVGIVAVRSLSARSALAFELDLVSFQSSKNSFYDGGRYLDRKTSISGQRALLMYKYRFGVNRPGKIHWVVNGGPYLHRIANESSRIGLDKLESDRFENMDIGVHLSAGFELNKNRFILEGGVRSDAGLLNINNGVLIPKKFDYTTTLQVGPYLSFRYAL